jgi:general secretion pathway protein A
MPSARSSIRAIIAPIICYAGSPQDASRRPRTRERFCYIRTGLSFSSEDTRVAEPPMYEAVYGFVQSPFALAPDPRFFYFSEPHEAAARLLLQSIRRKEGFIVLTGDIGTGKTTLCRALLQKLDERVFASLVLDPFLSVEELLREVLLDFGVTGRTGRLAHASRHDLTGALHEFLLSLVPINGSCVLIVDEAQHLSPEVLEQIRVLSNLETNSKKLLQIVLVGQLNLLEVLAAAGMRQLDQRISLRVMLRPLAPAEVHAYISHRVEVARASRPVSFSTEATRRVHAASGGVPRVINLICDRALMIAAERGLDVVTPAVVTEGARRLDLKRTRRAWLRSRRTLATAAIVVMVVAAAAVGSLRTLVDAPLPPLPAAPRLPAARLLAPIPPPPDDTPAETPRRPVDAVAPAPAPPRDGLPPA